MSMSMLSEFVPYITLATGLAAGWIAARRSWKQAIGKEQLEAARKVVAAITRVQWAITNKLDERFGGDLGELDEIQRHQAVLLQAVADSRLLLGEDIYGYLDGVLEAVEKDMDCLWDDGYRMVGFTWGAVARLMPALKKLIPGLDFKAPKALPLEFNSGRLIPATWNGRPRSLEMGLLGETRNGETRRLAGSPSEPR